MFHEYRERSGFAAGRRMPLLAHYLRSWDVTSAARVHNFVANSRTVAARLKTYYGRKAIVIHPPVNVGDFTPSALEQVGDYWLMVGELVRYKRPDLAVEAFSKSGKKLVVIGGGEMLSTLRALAGPTVSLLGPQPFAVLKRPYQTLPGAGVPRRGGLRDSFQWRPWRAAGPSSLTDAEAPERQSSKD
jgi:glycosyltransferase involved in cell wall biosynthesis